MKATNCYGIAIISSLLLLGKPICAQPINYKPYVFGPFAGPATIASVDGTNTDARFYFPQGATLDASGNLYVTESSTIRKITPAGVVTTIAGTPGVFGTNDGPAATAQFNTPVGLVIDSSNNVFIADSANDTIRKIDTNQVVTTFAGQPQGLPFFRNGTGTNAHFWSPMGLAIDSANNIYVADRNNNCIRMITPNGTVSTAAGSFLNGGSADGSPFSARFSGPVGVAVRFNLIFVADTGNNTIRVMAVGGGNVGTFAGLAGTSGSADGAGTAARFRGPYALAIDNNTNVFVAEYGNKLIRKITSAGVVTTIAGSANVSGALDGPTNTALFNLPVGIAVNGSGTLFIAEYGNCDIRSISSGTVTTWAGLPGTMYVGSNDGSGSAARFWAPWGIAAANSGNVYVSDTGNHTIRKITPDGTVSTLAGSPGVAGSADGTNSAALFRFPYGLAVDSTENIYVADEANATIRKITPDGTVTTLAGLARSFGSADGTNSTARFFAPSGLGLDASNNIYVVDSANNNIRKVTPDGVVTTIAGKAGSSGSTDGTNSIARFNFPWSVAVDSAFNVYVTDRGNGTIRKITPDGTVTTLGGAGNGAFGTDNGAGPDARFNQPFAIAVDPSGTLFVADSSNHAIRRGVPLALKIATQTTTVTVSWPAGSDYLLEQSSPLGHNWSPVLDPMQTNGATLSVSQSTGAQTYYRLRSP